MLVRVWIALEILQSKLYFSSFLNQGCHCYFKASSLIFPDIFREMLPISPWVSLIFLSFLSTDVGFERALTLFRACPSFGPIKRETVLQNDGTDQNAIKRWKTWSHSTGCVTEYKENPTQKWNYSNSKTFLIFPDFKISFFFHSFSLNENKIPWFSLNSLI